MDLSVRYVGRAKVRLKGGQTGQGPSEKGGCSPESVRTKWGRQRRGGKWLYTGGRGSRSGKRTEMLPLCTEERLRE